MNAALAPVRGGKRVLIDTQSLLHMKYAIGIDFINWSGLLGFIKSEVGTNIALGRVVCTIHPDQYRCGRLRGLRHDLERIKGITLIPCESRDAHDDQVVIKELEKAALVAAEVALVTTDKELIRRGWGVCRCANKPFSLVATLRPDPCSGNCRISRSIVESYIKPKIWPFHELAQQAHRIGQYAPAHSH